MMRFPAMLLAAVAAGLVGACATNKPVPPHVQTERSWREAANLALRAEQARAAGKLDEAIALNQQALIRNDQLGGAWNNLGIALMESHRGIEAMEAFQRAADLLPSDPKPYENLGFLYFNQNWYEDALKYYARSLERSPYWLPSLRGAIVSAKELLQSDEAGLERIKRGLMVENDAEWRRVFEVEQMRVRQDVAAKEKSARGSRIE